MIHIIQLKKKSKKKNKNWTNIQSIRVIFIISLLDTPKITKIYSRYKCFFGKPTMSEHRCNQILLL